LVVVPPRIRPEAFLLRHLLALRVIANLVDQRSTRAIVGVIRVLLNLSNSRVADDRTLLGLMARKRVHALRVELLALQIVLRKAAAMFDVVHLGDAEVVRSFAALHLEARI